MDDNKNLVTEVTENVETTPTEESVAEQVETPAEKTYTQSEMNAIMGRRLARNTAKIKKEYERKYGDLEAVLRAGTGVETVEEMTNTFADFYGKKGIKIDKKPMVDDKDIAVLAKADADEIIRAGYEDVVDEVDRLAEIGYENMSPRDKACFKVLAEHRRNIERQNELSKIGVTEDVYNSKEFQEFAERFRADTPVTDIYDIYRKTLPKKEIKPMGSLKDTQSGDTGVKDFYSFEEAERFTKEDFDKNPALYQAILKSMTKW